MLQRCQEILTIGPRLQGFAQSVRGTFCEINRERDRFEVTIEYVGSIIDSTLGQSEGPDEGMSYKLRPVLERAVALKSLLKCMKALSAGQSEINLRDQVMQIRPDVFSLLVPYGLPKDKGGFLTAIDKKYSYFIHSGEAQFIFFLNCLRVSGKYPLLKTTSLNLLNIVWHTLQEAF